MTENASFVDEVLRIAEAIPAGRVMTYGDIAAALGTRAARAVGQVLARHGDEVPWWRVVPASGAPPRGHEAAAVAHYLDESTPLTPRSADPSHSATAASVRIDLTRARWRP